ncbi:VIT domain-containing protein [Ramlibacter albus]|uniref:DUF2135 domain-containing protein n=1 Tax=Ramlibacter albus TaxID=2079448 RepID=A0A923S4D7_9BURK|nr:VIT domain-containing protein [Ramlibacter albus]MBC5766808.1 DUF2135 domain-containing protein [Ramlibacter albus]
MAGIGALSRRTFGLLAAAATTSLWALSPPPLPRPQWRPPVIVVPQAAQPVQLRAVTIDTDVLGNQAQSRIELRLFNPNPRVLEGELQFPLLEGQVVTGFALDVNGRLRDAVPVPKAKGQEIFEDIRRRRVDPGLLEATAGNQYKLRVFPLPPQGERRVQLTVTETLPRLHGRSHLRMPLVFASSVGQLQLRVRLNGIARKDVEPLSLPPGATLVGVGPGTSIAFQREGWTAPQGPAGWLHLSMAGAQGAQVLVGESAGKRYFSAQVPVRDELVRRPDPTRIALVWDASGSGAGQARVLPVLDAYFRSLRSSAQVTLLVVRNRVEAPRQFTVANGNWDELHAALRAEPFDGSSNFDELPIPEGTQATLFVSDGLATDGKRLIGYRHAAPVFAISGSAQADVPRLTRLAERTGGAFVDATQLSPGDAVRAMQYAGWRIERLASFSAEQLVAPRLHIRDGLVAVAGELRDASARIEIQLRHADGRRRVVPLEVAAPALAGRWPAQQWAQWRSAELAENATLHQAQLREIAAQHGVVGPNSSLIVLELATDYARYELPAPPDLADEVARLRGVQFAQATQQRAAHIEAMVRQFEARQRWWERDFPKDEPKRRDELAKDRNAPAALGEQRSAKAGIPMPSVAPAAPAAAPLVRPAPATAADAGTAAAQARESSALRREAAGKSADAVAQSSARRGSPDASAEPPPSSIALQPWTPDAPYLRRLQSAAAADAYRVYLDERAQNAASSAFFIDAAGVFFQRGDEAVALRVLSNLAEMNLENRQLLRLYAYRLTQAKRSDLAVPVFERVAELAPNEPQSWRDLGLAFADSGRPQKAVDALWEVVARPWPRFAGVNMIALAELNAIAAAQPVDLSRVDTRLRRNLPLDLRVVMAWDTDDTDIDLWVTDPNGEVASYARRLTYQGGAMSPDATGGYGPEEFALRHAKPGRYTVQAQFYGHTQQFLSAGTTIMVRVTTGFGTAQARDEWLTLRVTQGREVVRVGDVLVGAAP